MVHVYNLTDSSEGSQFTKPDVPSSSLQNHIQGLMRDIPLKPHTSNRSEPGHLDFSGPSIYQSCDGTARAHKPLTRAEQNFTPDMSYSGAQGREFLNKMNEQRHKPIELNNDGKYEVRPGDTLATIAERTLKQDGHKPTQAEIQSRSKELEQLNGNQIGNRHLLKPGMQLKLAPTADDACRRPAEKTLPRAFPSAPEDSSSMITN
jgi:hypothetical protein